MTAFIEALAVAWKIGFDLLVNCKRKLNTPLIITRLFLGMETIEYKHEILIEITNSLWVIYYMYV